MAICRACLESDDCMYSISEVTFNIDLTISAMLEYCTAKKMEINENLPDKVCIPCFKTIRIAFNFIKQFNESQEKLKSGFSKQKEKETIIKQGIDDKDIDENSDDCEEDSKNTEEQEIGESEEEIFYTKEETLKNSDDCEEDPKNTAEQEIGESEEEIFYTEEETLKNYETNSCDEETENKVFINQIHKETFENYTSVNCNEDYESTFSITETVNTDTSSNYYINQEMILEDLQSEVDHYYTDENLQGLSLTDVELMGETVTETLEAGCEDLNQVRDNQAEEVISVNTKTRTKYQRVNHCPVCQLQFKIFSKFINHLKSHESQKFHCNLCPNKTLFNATEFTKHLSQMHRYCCIPCKKMFSSTSGLSYHNRVANHHRNQNKYECQFCDKTFPVKFALNRHHSIHLKNENYLCGKCGKKFHTYDTYSYHKRTHDNTRNHLCTICGRTFLQSVHLRDHMQVHTGVKRYICNFCEKAYTSVYQLHKHGRRHHPEEFKKNKGLHT